MLTDPPDPPYSYVMTQRDFVATRGDFEDALRGDYYLALRNATHATKPPLVCACFICAVQSLHWNRCVLRRRASSFARGSSASTATPCTVRARKRARCMRVCVRVCVCVCVCVCVRVFVCVGLVHACVIMGCRASTRAVPPFFRVAERFLTSMSQHTACAAAVGNIRRGPWRQPAQVARVLRGEALAGAVGGPHP
jgi:hypothetical protein